MKSRVLAVAIVLAMLTLAITANGRWSEAQQGTALVGEIRQAVGESAPAVPRAVETAVSQGDFKRSPVMFVENAGQWDDSARFQVWGGPAERMWLAEDAIWITAVEDRGAEGQRSERQKSEDQKSEDQRSEGQRSDRSMDRAAELRPADSDTLRRGVAVKLSFVGANPHPRVEPFERLDTTVSYFLGNDPASWWPDVPVWRGVRYVDLYPGIDLAIGSRAGRFEWDLISAPPSPDFGSAPGSHAGQTGREAIRLRVEGADSARLDGGDLLVAIGSGELAIPWPAAPFAVQAEMLRTDGHVDTLEIPPDPTGEKRPYDLREAAPATNSANLVYSTFLGGRVGETAAAIASDTTGRAFVAGFTDSDDFPTTPGAFDVTPNGRLDAFVARLNATGSVLETATFLGGQEVDGCQTLAVDGSGRVYLTGWTESSNFPITSGAFDRSYNGAGDAFVLRLSADGTALDYSSFLGGAGWDKGVAVAVDANNNVWAGGYGNLVHDLLDGITGATLRTIYPGCGGYGGLIDSYGVLWSARYSTSLLRYDPAANTIQCITMPGSYGLGIDSNGVIWNSRADQGSVTKLDRFGTILDTVSTHGSVPKGVTVTADGNVWIANNYSDTVVRLRNDGALVATIRVGDTPTGVAVDAAGKVWVTNYGSSNAMRIDPATNSVDLTVSLGSGATPYTYSDMTGSVILGSPPRGKWIVVHDSGAAGTAWGAVSWTQQTPPGTSLVVRVRSAESPVGLGNQPWVSVGNGVVFTNVPAGRYLQVEAQFTGTDQGASPILYDLTVASRCTH